MARIDCFTILQGFDAQYGRFLEGRSADWHAVQQAMKAVSTSSMIIMRGSGGGAIALYYRWQKYRRGFLYAFKEHYTRLPDYPRRRLWSIFQPAYCRLFDHRSLTPERLFIFSSQNRCQRFRTIPRPIYQRLLSRSRLGAAADAHTSDLTAAFARSSEAGISAKYYRAPD